jgi:N-acetyl-gamma-glutamylphosphate reductase
VYDDIHGVDQAQSLVADANKLVDLAASGEFAINDEGGKSLIDAINAFLHWISDNSDHIRTLEQTRKLGSSRGAKIMTEFLPHVAADEQGFVTQLNALKESLLTAKQAIKVAMENYERTDEAVQADLRNIDSGS